MLEGDIYELSCLHTARAALHCDSPPPFKLRALKKGGIANDKVKR